MVNIFEIQQSYLTKENYILDSIYDVLIESLNLEVNTQSISSTNYINKVIIDAEGIQILKNLLPQTPNDLILEEGDVLLYEFNNLNPIKLLRTIDLESEIDDYSKYFELYKDEYLDKLIIQDMLNDEIDNEINLDNEKLNDYINYKFLVSHKKDVLDVLEYTFKILWEDTLKEQTKLKLESIIDNL